MTENDDEYYENMIRAEKRVDPKEEIAELKKKNKAIHQMIKGAHFLLEAEGHKEAARIVNEVNMILIDLDEDPEMKNCGKKLADNITRPKPEDPNQTQLLDWEQRQSQERVRQRPILGNRILTPVREEPASDPNVIVPMPQGGLPEGFMANYNDPYNNRNNPYTSPSFYAQRTPPINADNLARAQRIRQRRVQMLEDLRDRDTFVQSHMDIAERIADGEIPIGSLRGTRYTDEQLNWLAQTAIHINAERTRTPNDPPSETDTFQNPLNSLRQRRALHEEQIRRDHFLHQQRDVVRMLESGQASLSVVTNSDWTEQERNWIITAAFPNRTAANLLNQSLLSDSPLNDAARENQARMERTCRFGGVDCEHEATVMNEHGTPMCDPCSERDYHARGSNPSYEILPLIYPPDPTR